MQDLVLEKTIVMYRLDASVATGPDVLNDFFQQETKKAIACKESLAPVVELENSNKRGSSVTPSTREKNDEPRKSIKSGTTQNITRNVGRGNLTGNSGGSPSNKSDDQAMDNPKARFSMLKKMESFSGSSNNLLNGSGIGMGEEKGAAGGIAQEERMNNIEAKLDLLLSALGKSELVARADIAEVIEENENE